MASPLKALIQSHRLVILFGAAVVAAATWLVLLSGEISGLLLIVVVFSEIILPQTDPRAPGLLFTVSAFFAALFFAAPRLLQRTPKSPEEVARFNRSSWVWLVVCLLAVLWFGEPDL